MEGYYKVKTITDGISKRMPREEQREAFNALKTIFTFPINEYRGTMVSLPTGGGKTYTAVKWLCDNVLNRNIKVLWLAQSTYLLDQALKTILDEAKYTNNREIINVRVVSSNEHHANAGTIDLSDDIIICTTQTAVLNYNSTSLDLDGNSVKKPLGKFIDAYIGGSLFIVIDEAHHTPAYGCRNMILNISENLTMPLYILGLTATPYHNDQRISGWLQKIYNYGENGVAYRVSEKELQFKNVLAVPKYIQKDTNISVAVDDRTYERLQKDHKDLPENIIDMLAENNVRNTLIANDYIQNKEQYGKTIIFADRWIQCESIVSKLNKNGVKADAVYSKIENGKTGGHDLNGRSQNEHNKIAMEKFRNNELDVIVNVKMLTEGVDVPDVKTVMLTRQTTSPILFTQMVGRALRGKKAGGGEDKSEANIVLFVDQWERFIDFRAQIGDAELIPSPEVCTRINDLISIELVKRACDDLPFDEMLKAPPYMSLIPLGWYSIEFTKSVINDNGEEEMITAREAVPVYNINKEDFECFINNADPNDFPECEDESIKDDVIDKYAQKYMDKYFKEEDNIGDNLKNYIGSLLKHIAQNKKQPKFINFRERNYYNLSEIAKEYLSVNPVHAKQMCLQMFNDESKLWKTLYKNSYNFYCAFRREQDIALFEENIETEQPKETQSTESVVDWDSLREQVLIRDNYTCKCCGKQKGRGIKLEVDHIIPVNMGGRSVVDNLQTLCKECNNAKGTDSINFNIIKSPLDEPLPFRNFKICKSDNIENYIARIVNFIYHCKAFKSVKYSKRSNGEYYSQWIISIYSGNNIEFIKKYEAELLNAIHKFGYMGCKKIVFE